MVDKVKSLNVEVCGPTDVMLRVFRVTFGSVAVVYEDLEAAVPPEGIQQPKELEAHLCRIPPLLSRGEELNLVPFLFSH